MDEIERNSLAIVLQHGGTFHDVLLVNWTDVHSGVLQNNKTA